MKYPCISSQPQINDRKIFSLEKCMSMFVCILHAECMYYCFNRYGMQVRSVFAYLSKSATFSEFIFYCSELLPYNTFTFCECPTLAYCDYRGGWDTRMRPRAPCWFPPRSSSPEECAEETHDADVTGNIWRHKYHYKIARRVRSTARARSNCEHIYTLDLNVIPCFVSESFGWYFIFCQVLKPLNSQKFLTCEENAPIRTCDFPLHQSFACRRFLMHFQWIMKRARKGLFRIF